MNCMKCGNETQGDQVFCAECLAEMEKYPVKPGIVVQIPVQPPKKQPHHRRSAVSHEDQVKRLAKYNHRLTLALIMAVTTALFFALLYFGVLERSGVHKLLGQNYSVAQATEVETVETYTEAVE